MLRSTRAIPVRPGSVSVFFDNNASIFMTPMMAANPQPLVEARRTLYHIRHCDTNEALSLPASPSRETAQAT
ncbi:hypothetical protein FMUAM8_23710 [Nocardia cyriacigeorgica]|nr:hypothetical protein FMUAM8_23710 [Nocardia cyriacigeorgica]BDU06116.1 hypothetical protein FMUBM48_23790 [Nocardia cyriacigeorgica]